jgi:hypothetical protein
MTPDEIDLLIAAMRANGVTRLEWTQHRKGTELCLTLPEGEGAPPAPPAAEVAGRTRAVTSPGIGRFVPRGGDDGLAPLAAGATVRKHEPLGYVAQGAVLQILTAPEDGILAGGLPEAGRVLGYGEKLLELEGDAE